MPSHSWPVKELLHLRNRGVGDIDAGDVLVPSAMQLCRESGVATTDHQQRVFAMALDGAKLLEGIVQFIVSGIPVKKAFSILEASIPKVGIRVIWLHRISLWAVRISWKRHRQLIAVHGRERGVGVCRVLWSLGVLPLPFTVQLRSPTVSLFSEMHYILFVALSCLGKSVAIGHDMKTVVGLLYVGLLSLWQLLLIMNGISVLWRSTTKQA